MSWKKAVLPTLLAGIVFSAALIPEASAQVPVRTGPAAGPGTTRRPRVEPCWEVAGVPKSAVQQRRVITQRTRQQVETVCANSSLSVSQKRQKIQAIHQRERQEIDGIISIAQQEAMRSCQEQRHGGASGGHGGGGHGRPCGELSTGHKGHPVEEDDEQPADQTAKPN